MFVLVRSRSICQLVSAYFISCILALRTLIFAAVTMNWFKHATVQNYKTGELETASYHIIKSVWLRDEFHPHVTVVNRLVEDVTGLTISTAEELQVVNYGTGGHCEPHFDFARDGHTLLARGGTPIGYQGEVELHSHSKGNPTSGRITPYESPAPPSWEFFYIKYLYSPASEWR